MKNISPSTMLIELMPYLFFFTIGALAFNYDQESVSFASTLKNFSIYSTEKSYLNIIKNADFTIQIHLPYLLLHLGISEKFLNLILSGFTSLISMSAFYILSKKISKNYFISLIIPIILLSHNFINTRWYGIHYPTDFFYFGQMGMYLTLISITFFTYEKNEIGINFLILNLFCHAAWGLLNIFIFFVLFFFKSKKRKIFFSNILLFFTCVFLVLISLYLLKSNQILGNYNDSAIITGYGNFHELLNKNFDIVEETHKLKIIDNHFFSYQSLFNFFRLIFFDLIFLITFLLWRKDLDEKLFQLMLVMSLIIILIYFGLFFYDHIYNLLSKLTPFLSGVYERIIINRYLNLINIFIICFHLLIFFNVLEKKNNKKFINNYLFIIMLILINTFFFKTKLSFEIDYLKYIDIYNLVIWFTIPFNIFRKIKFKCIT